MEKGKKLKALTLSGGGSRGAFQTGALKHLLQDRKEHFDIITGISVGALNGSFLAQFKKGQEKEAAKELFNIWNEIDDGKVWKHWFPFRQLEGFWKHSLLNSKPLRKMVENRLNVDLVRNSGKQLRVGAVSLTTGELRQFAENDPDLKRAVMASSAFPVFLEPVQIGNELYTDGGVREITPLKTAIELGADHITIIGTSPIKPNVRNAKDFHALDVAFRTVDLMSEEVFVTDLNRFININKLVKKGKLTPQEDNKRVIDYEYIFPEDELIQNSLDFSPSKIKEMIDKGYKRAVSKSL